METEYLGNKELLTVEKVAFLCSREVSSLSVLRCYDWTTEVSGTVEAVVSGFHSGIEKDILTLLLMKRQPVILVLARKMYRTLPDELQTALDEGQLLIISTAPGAVRVGREAALARNSYIAWISDRVVFGYISPHSDLLALYQTHRYKSTLLTAPPEGALSSL